MSSDDICYSDKYSDDRYVYRHVTLPPKLGAKVSTKVEDTANSILPCLCVVAGAQDPPDDGDGVAQLGRAAERGMGPLHGTYQVGLQHHLTPYFNDLF